MTNFIKLLQEIFMGKEDNSARVGLTFFRQEASIPVVKPKPQELKLSELMKKNSY